MDLIDNAVASIEMGVQDYRSPDERRVLSALRNLYSGTLLLLKEALSRESPDNSDLLIYTEIVPMKKDGQLTWVPKSQKKTVDYHEIQERFKSLGLKLNWEPLDKLRAIRNQVEHHKPAHPKQAALEAVAACFVVVKQIIEDHLDQKPEQIFDTETWAIMLQETKTLKSTEQQCRESLKLLENIPEAALPALEKIRCPDCGSALLQAEANTYVDAEFNCRTCGSEFSLASIIVDAAHRAYPRTYEKKVGYVDEIGHCPTCGEEAFVIAHDICLACAESRPYSECEMCGTDLSLDESDEPFCSYCTRHADRDD